MHSSAFPEFFCCWPALTFTGPTGACREIKRGDSIFLFRPGGHRSQCFSSDEIDQAARSRRSSEAASGIRHVRDQLSNLLAID
jgi:hypothetical protein